MVRSLPKRHNPLILPEASPDYEELLARRRLGKTHLAVKPAQVGTSNATKPENLGPFEYAHLRAPLPKDLRGSEIFPSHSPQQHPETYFLMRRSKDGYISATGMFKIAFPWAKLEEERAEREYLKSRKETSEDEIAGNIWISPMFALELAKEYRMFDWVRALLDSREIVQSPSTAKKQITPPPKFEMPPMEPTSQLPPASRTRSRRSASPSKKLGSPRKSRQTRSAKEANVAAPTAASATLQSALDTAASTADSESVDGAVEQNGEVNVEEKVAEEPEQKTETKSESKETAATEVDEKVKEDAENTVEVRKDVEASQTSVSVEMPVSLPEPPPPEDMEKMIAKAKEMVEEATKQQAEAETAAASSSSPNAAKKRKSDELVEEGEEQIADVRAQPTKKARVLEEKLRRERVRNRALVGVTATLALAAAIPYFF